MLQRIRDESHRFAITFHRELRGKRMTKSVLDDVPGLGEVRRKRLVKELGGVNAVKQADLETLQGPVVAPRSRGRGAARARSTRRAGRSAMTDPWEAHARGGRTSSPRASTPSTPSRSSRWSPRTCRRRATARRRAAVRAGRPCRGRGRPRRGRHRPGVGAGVGRVDATAARGGRTSAAARRRCRSRTGAFDAAVACLVFEHIVDLDDAIAEVARVLAPGRAVPVPPEPPAAADAGLGLDRRPDARSARAVLAGGGVPHRGVDGGGGAARASSSASSTGRCRAT